MKTLFFSILFISFSTFAEVLPVDLPAIAKSSLDKIYESTRSNSDCCGVSSVLIYKVKSGRATPSDIDAALLVAAKSEKEIAHALNQNRFSKNPDEMSLGQFLAQYADESLAEEASALVNAVGAMVGHAPIKIKLSAAIEPAPSVDGTIDVAVTKDGKYILIRVTDNGA